MIRNGLTGMLFAGAIVAPGTAFAVAGEIGPGGSGALLWLWGLVALAVGFAGGWAGASWRTKRKARVGDARLARAPCAHAAWDIRGRFVCSDKLAGWLGLAPPVSTPEALVDCLEVGDRDRLAAAIRDLRANNRAFSLVVAGADGTAHFAVDGVPMPAAAESAHEVWFRDVSALQQARIEAQAAAEAKTRAHTQIEAVIECAPFPIWQRDADLRLARVNAAYVRAVDADSPDQVIADQIELVSNALLPSPRDNAECARDTGAPQTTTCRAVIDGHRRALAVTDTPLAQSGRVTGFAIDVTDFEEARAELLRHVEAHAETLDKLSAAVAIFGPDRHLEFFNGNYARLWRLDEDWLASKPHHSEILEAKQVKRRLPEQANFPAWKQRRLTLYSDLIDPREELWHLPDGSTLRVIAQPHPFGGLLFVYEDVTDRLALERSYNTLTAVQRETLDKLHEGVAVFGTDGLLKLSNPAFARMWRLDPEVLKSRPHLSEIVERCRPLYDDDAEWERLCAGILIHDSERGPTRGRMPRPDGTILDYVGVPLPDGATLLTYLDVSDSVRIERALRERNEALETADRLKSEFIANVSYELRTPLNSIIGFTEILNNDYFGTLNDRQRGYIEGTLDASQQLLRLINDILDLAVIEAGAMELEVGEFEVRDALETVLAIAGEQAQKKRITVDLDCPETIGKIKADERRIKQALFNLLSNAIKFTPSEGHITLGCEASDADIRLFVSDSGVGMSPAERRSAFDTFWKGTGRHKEHGAGLGLSLVRRFIELHGGEVRIGSHAGNGTTVICRLPRLPKARQPDGGDPGTGSEPTPAPGSVRAAG